MSAQAIPPREPWRLSRTEWASCLEAFDPPAVAGEARSARGRRRIATTKQLVEAVLFHHFHSRAPEYRSAGWNHLPRSLGVSPSTANRRYREWVASGEWERCWDVLMAHRTRAAAPAGRDVPRLESRLAADAPISVLVADLGRAHRFFNYRFFGGTLPTQTAVTLEHSGSTCRFGVFNPQGWPRRAHMVDHIAITAAALRDGPVQILATLLHEIAHQWNRAAGIADGGRGNYHNQHFRDTAHLAGLRCIQEPGSGYSHTVPTPRALEAISALLARA